MKLILAYGKLKDGFGYPGTTEDVPLSNLYIPNASENPIHPEVVDYYASKGLKGEPYKASPLYAKPIVIKAQEKDFPQWEKLNKDPLDTDYPELFVMDGVHRVKAAEKNGKKEVEVKFDTKWNYVDAQHRVKGEQEKYPYFHVTDFAEVPNKPNIYLGIKGEKYSNDSYDWEGKKYFWSAQLKPNIKLYKPEEKWNLSEFSAAASAIGFDGDTFLEDDGGTGTDNILFYIESIQDGKYDSLDDLVNNRPQYGFHILKDFSYDGLFSYFKHKGYHGIYDNQGDYLYEDSDLEEEPQILIFNPADIIWGDRTDNEDFHKLSALATSEITWEEVWENSKKNHTGEISTPAIPEMKKRMQGLVFTKETIPVAEIYSRSWTPEQPMEGKEDEEYAQNKYSKLKTQAPPIAVEKTAKGYALIDGTHRTRAAYLRQNILAYVGIKKADDSEITGNVNTLDAAINSLKEQWSDYGSGYLNLNNPQIEQEIREDLTDIWKKPLYRMVRTKTQEIDKKRLGIFWTYNKDRAKAYWGEGEYLALLTTHVAEKDIDWVSTVEQHLKPKYAAEDEVRLHQGAVPKLADIKWMNEANAEQFDDAREHSRMLAEGKVEGTMRLVLTSLSASTGSIIVYHGTNQKFDKIKPYTLGANDFGGIFASSNRMAAESHGKYLYSMNLERSEILTQYELDYSLDPVKIKKILSGNARGLSDEDLDLLWECVVEDVGTGEDKRLREILKADDAGDAKWRCQGIRGKIAKEFGYKAVEMEDEHGTSYLVLPGTEISEITNSEDGDEANAEQFDDAQIPLRTTYPPPEEPAPKTDGTYPTRYNVDKLMFQASRNEPVVAISDLWKKEGYTLHHAKLDATDTAGLADLKLADKNPRKVNSNWSVKPLLFVREPDQRLGSGDHYEESLSLLVDKIKSGELVIDAMSPWVYMKHSGKVVGTLSCDDVGAVIYISVDKNHRRKGIAAAMYEYMEKLIGKPTYSDLGTATNEAKNLRKAYDKHKKVTSKKENLPFKPTAEEVLEVANYVRSPILKEQLTALVFEDTKISGSNTEYQDEFPKAGSTVDGRKVGSTISNLGSISATLTDWEELPGIREISMSDWEADPHKLFYSKSDIDRCKKLAAEIEHSKRIDPLIVVIPSDKDKDGVYVLEGGHRLGALHILKAKSFPALVVIDTEDRAVEAKASLKGLEAEAAKCETFEEFKKAFSVDIKHGLYWHVTADPDFKIDPSKGPSDMSSMSNGKPKLGKLMVTSHLENWTDYYGKDRPYAAEIDMSEVDPKDYQQVARGFGNEFWVENPAKAKVVKVYKVQQALRRDAQYHSKLPNSDKELRQIFDKVHPSLVTEKVHVK